MNQQQILEKAIQKAMANGFNGVLEDVITYDKEGNQRLDQYRLIMFKPFLKALWPEEINGGGLVAKHNQIAIEWWQYHLQQIVIAEDPIKYLGENI